MSQREAWVVGSISKWLCILLLEWTFSPDNDTQDSILSAWSPRKVEESSLVTLISECTNTKYGLGNSRFGVFKFCTSCRPIFHTQFSKTPRSANLNHHSEIRWPPSQNPVPHLGTSSTRHRTPPYDPPLRYYQIRCSSRWKKCTASRTDHTASNMLRITPCFLENIPALQALFSV